MRSAAAHDGDMNNNTTSIRSRITKAASAVGLICGLGFATLAHGAGTASAPEPAQLVAPLAAVTGYTAEARLVSSHVSTNVVLFPASAVNSPNGPAAGTPCSPGQLAAGATTTHVIQVLPGTTSYRRCL
jgi:hypothetical protein